MVGRHKIDPEQLHASMNVSCPHRGARIEPKDYKRVDWEDIECPNCEEKFVPTKQRA